MDDANKGRQDQGFYRRPRAARLTTHQLEVVRIMGRGAVATRIVELVVGGVLTLQEAGRVYLALDQAGCFSVLPDEVREPLPGPGGQVPKTRPAERWSEQALNQLLEDVKS